MTRYINLCKSIGLPLAATLYRGLELLSFLKGSTNRFRACGSATGSYGYLTCSAISVAIVMNTVLNVAADTLDMLLAGTLFVLVHF